MGSSESCRIVIPLIAPYLHLHHPLPLDSQGHYGGQLRQEERGPSHEPILVYIAAAPNELQQPQLALVDERFEKNYTMLRLQENLIALHNIHTESCPSHFVLT
jgi:hypothetical protein